MHGWKQDFLLQCVRQPEDSLRWVIHQQRLIMRVTVLMLLWIKKRRNIWQRDGGKERWAQEGGDSWGKSKDSTSWLLVWRQKTVVKRVGEGRSKKDGSWRRILKRRVTFFNFAMEKKREKWTGDRKTEGTMEKERRAGGRWEMRSHAAFLCFYIDFK